MIFIMCYMLWFFSKSIMICLPSRWSTRKHKMVSMAMSHILYIVAWLAFISYLCSVGLLITWCLSSVKRASYFGLLAIFLLLQRLWSLSNTFFYLLSFYLLFITFYLLLFIYIYYYSLFIYDNFLIQSGSRALQQRRFISLCMVLIIPCLHFILVL